MKSKKFRPIIGLCDLKVGDGPQCEYRKYFTIEKVAKGFINDRFTRVYFCPQYKSSRDNCEYSRLEDISIEHEEK